MDLSRSPITRRAAAALAFSAPIGLAAIAAADDETSKRPDPARESEDGQGVFEAWWQDLEKWETEATRALLHMADRREETVAFLKDRMRPLKITPAEVRALLLKLGNPNEKVWKPAFEELEYFDPRLAIDLETLMDRYKEAPAQQRMVEVMSGRAAGSLGTDPVEVRRLSRGDGYNFVSRNRSWWAEHRIDRINHPEGWGNLKKKWTRAVRALVLLEYIANPGAVAILREMATGHLDAQPTKVAKDALGRLGKT
jgi:hypothetical protein